MVKSCVLLQNSNASSKDEYIYSVNIDCFVVDSSHLHLSFVAFYLLIVVNKQ